MLSTCGGRWEAGPEGVERCCYQERTKPMYKRNMTTQELMSWVELAPTADEMQELADAANAGYPEMVTVMNDGEMMLWMLEHPAAITQWQTRLWTLGEVLFSYSIVPASQEQMHSAVRLLRAQPELEGV